jgi:hypothetical protein
VGSVALSLFLLQNGSSETPEASKSYRRAARCYLDQLLYVGVTNQSTSGMQKCKASDFPAGAYLYSVDDKRLIKVIGKQTQDDGRIILKYATTLAPKGGWYNPDAELFIFELEPDRAATI